MRLYKMELYKLCTRKLFLFGASGVIGIVLFYFLSFVFGAESTINGEHYKGYEAVRMDRKITEEFAGVLTDEKVAQIVEKYGFPHKVREGVNMFLDGNFLNSFVMEYLSDGYIQRWDDYQIATCTYPIADTMIGEAEALTGKKVILDYYYGWKVFFDVLGLGFVLGSILVIFGISPVFADEVHTEMLPLLFTTKEGKKGDIRAKIAAGLTITVVIYLVIVILDLLLCGLFFGFGGLEYFTGLLFGYLLTWFKTSLLPVKYFVLLFLLFAFAGGILLCAMTMLVSACFNSPFHAVVVDALLWVCPVLIQIMSGRVTFTMRIMPLYMVMPHNAYEIFHLVMIPVMAVMAVAAALVCLAVGYNRYKSKE